QHQLPQMAGDQIWSAGSNESMSLAACRQLDHALRGKLRQGDGGSFIIQLFIIHARTATLDEASSLAIGATEARFAEEFIGRDASLQPVVLNLDRREIFAKRALLEGAPSRLRGATRAFFSAAKGGGLIGQYLLRLVDLRALQFFQALDLLQRQLGEEAQEAPDVRVLGVAPELPVIVGGKALFVEPDRAGRRLAHLLSGGGRQQRRGKAKELALLDPPGQFDAIDDVAPLIGTAHLQATAVASGKLQEIVGLEDHVVELQEGERLLPLEAQLHRVEAQHAIDG